MSNYDPQLLDLPDLQLMEVAPVSLGQLPYYRDLHEWACSTQKFIQSKLDVDFKGHKCERCDGHGGPNPNYEPTKEEKEDPLVFVAIPYQGYRLKYDTKHLVPHKIPAIRHKIKIMPQSDWNKSDKPSNAWVFFTTSFHPCFLSRDWKAINAILAMAGPEPNRNEVLKTWLKAQGRTQAALRLLSIQDRDYKHVRYFHDEKTAQELFAQVQEAEEKLDNGELTDFIASMCNPSFGGYSWSLNVND